jgi:DNA-binding MarR family transcriptional regulator
MVDSVDRMIQEHDWAEYPELDLEVEGIVNRIHILWKYLQRSFDETASESGINKGELDVMKHLHHAGEPYRLSPSKLSDKLHLSSGAMTNRLDRLESRNLIRRLPDPSDRRGTLVELTKEGVNIYWAAIDRQIKKEKGLCAPLDTTERKQLSNLLRKLIREIESSPGFPWKH